MSERLLKLSQADHGFFILALHAQAEAMMRQELGPRVTRQTPFPEIVQEYFELHAPQKESTPQQGGGKRKYFNKSRLLDEHELTNDVRHQFAMHTREDAQAAASTFWDFLGYAVKQNDPEFQDIPSLFQEWNQRKLMVVEKAEWEALHAQAKKARVHQKEVLSQYQEIQEQELEVKRMRAELELLHAEYNKLRQKMTEKDAAFDEKRQQIFALEKKLKEQTPQPAAAALEEYIAHVSRLTYLTRTRRAFEEQVLRLTPEQAQLVERLPLDRDTLIRGGAGTGKSLVLLKLAQRILEPPQGALDFGTPTPTLKLLTFTKAMTRYGAYLSGLLGGAVSSAEFQTVDSLLNEIIYKALGAYVHYHWENEAWVEEIIGSSPLDPNEFKFECEHLIWGWALTWDEYRDIERSGHKKPLGENQRREVWRQQEAVAQKMLDRKYMSPVLAAKLLEFYPEVLESQKVDYVLLDEAQDLLPVRLKILRSLARKGFVLAADEGQTLNQSRSPFVRAGLDFQGKSKVLHTNFRNTAPIEALARRFYNGQVSAGAIRQGPFPEWTFSKKPEELIQHLIAKIHLLTDKLRYDLENILVIHSGEKSGLVEALRTAGLPLQDVKNKDFQFDKSGCLRVSPFPSAKGLDSPVVLILWHNVAAFTGWSDEAVWSQQRNFCYVAISRALEHVHLFVHDDNSPITQELRDVSES